MLRSLIVLPFLFGALVSSLACQKNSLDRREDPASVAGRLIDSQKSSEAIKYLEPFVEAEPERRDLKVALASAYAHRAGFKVQKLIPLFQNLRQIGTPSSGTLSAAQDPLAKGTLSLVDQSSEVAKTFNSIPEVNEEQVADLLRAWDLLLEMKDGISPPDALFKGIIEVLLIKHVVQFYLLAPDANLGPTALGRCQVDIELIEDLTPWLVKLLTELATDIQITHPSQATAMAKFKEETEAARTQILERAQTANEMDRISSLILKRGLVKAGFGKALLCPEETP